MLDIHAGLKVEDSLVMKTNRLQLELLDEDLYEAFYIGYSDRLHEEHDSLKYNRVSSLNTIRELFYFIGYRFSGNEIYLSGLVRKSLPNLEGFKRSIMIYLDGLKINDFYLREK